jgi:hypothetical protein
MSHTPDDVVIRPAFFLFFFAFKFFFFVCWARDGYRSSGGCIFPLLDSARHRI